jgi:hypothetical protein
MAKKHDRLAGTKATVRWRISLLKGTPAKFLGYVEAADEKAARRKNTKLLTWSGIDWSPGATGYDPRLPHPPGPLTT